MCKKRDSGAYYGSKIHAGVSYGKKKMWFQTNKCSVLESLSESKTDESWTQYSYGMLYSEPAGDDQCM